MMAAKAKWPTKRLGELAEFRNGVNYNKSSFGEGVKVVGVSDFQDYTKPKYEELEQINPEGIVTERNILRDGDIVFVRSNGNRELIGRSLLIEQPPEEITHSAFTIRLRFTAREVHPKFYAYCFRAPLIRHALTAQGGGTNINNLNQDILNALEVPLPPLLVQRRVASILSAYDELMENSQRRIRILEAMARALYREWFVHFRFPGHEKHLRVASRPGDIPQAWQVKKLGHIADISWGDTSMTKAAYVEDGYAAYSASGLDGKLDHYDFDRTAIVLSAIGAQCGRTWLARGKWSCIKNTIRFWSKDECASTEFLFVATEGQDFWPRRGAAQPFISQGDAERIELLIPDRSTMKRFTAFAANALEQIAMLQEQIQNLRRTRDLLLPRLLSGQVPIRVPNDEASVDREMQPVPVRV
jgi:type I restriction enzyme S subunit